MARCCSRWNNVFTEPDLNTVVLPFLGISVTQNRFQNKRNKWKLPKLWLAKN